MKHLKFTLVFPYATIPAMYWFMTNEQTVQFWCVTSIGLLIWLLMIGNDVKNGKSN